MCDLYSFKNGQKAIRDPAKVMVDHAGNIPSLPAIFPNGRAPVVRTMPDGKRELLMMRWGFPPPNIRTQNSHNVYLSNVRNTESRCWQTYLKQLKHRCLVPVTSFAERDDRRGDDKPSIWTWFARDDTRAIMFFAGIWREWEGDRGTRTAPDLGKHLVFTFLATDAGPDVRPIHPDATPVLLLSAKACDTWLAAPWEIARNLQKPPPKGSLKIVAIGAEDPYQMMLN